MRAKGCIIYCIEKGILEKYTILSISSVKKFGGFLSQYDIFCFQPRKEFPISSNAKKILSSFGVKFIDTPLNIKHRYYSIVNKSIVCDYMAKNFKYDQYVYLDGDTLVLNEPTGLSSSSGDISLSPVYTKGIGINGKHDKNYGYWKKLFDRINVDFENLIAVKTIFEKEEIIGYWNGAVIINNNQNSFFQRWNDLVNYSLDNEIYKESGIYFVEQTCLAATILSGLYSLETLPLNYNFPLAERMLDGLNDSGFGEIVILHHLSDLHLLRKYESVLKGSYKYQWIQEKVREIGIEPHNKKFILARKLDRIEKGIKERLYYLIYKFTNSWHT